MKNIFIYTILLSTLYSCTKSSYIEPILPNNDGYNPNIEVNNDNNYNQVVMGDDVEVTFKIYSNWGSASIVNTTTESDTVMHYIGFNEVMDTTVTYYLNSGESIDILSSTYSCFIELDVFINDEYFYTVYDDGQQGTLTYTYQN